MRREALPTNIGVHVIKRIFQHTATLLILAASYSYAGPIDLGKAGDYTLLATGTSVWNGAPLYGNLVLGSEAYIHGNVGVRDELNMGSGAIIYGDADFGSVNYGAGTSIMGSATQQNATFWDDLYQDLKSASQSAKALGGVNAGYINSSQTFNSQGDLSVFNITGLNLTAGNSLTLKGSANDVFIINVDYFGFMLGGGAAIILDGISAENVLFNMHGLLNAGHVNVAAGTMKGTYIAPDAYMQLGDGLDLEGVRFLGAGISGNLQTVHGFPGATPPVEIPEPSMLLLLGLGLLGLGVVRLKSTKT
jgi:hypothetical protein